MNSIMVPLNKKLEFEDPEKISNKIESFIRKYVYKFDRKGVILGLSGGIDSVLVAHLCSRALGPEKVFSVYMPEKDSDARHRKDAEATAKRLAIHFEIVDLVPFLESIGIYDKFPMNILRKIPTKRLRGFLTDAGKQFYEKVTGDNLILESRKGSNERFISGGNAYANIKHRIRMALLHYYGEYYNLLTVGCANQTEFLTGVFVKFGIDGVADLMPLLPLYKVQVKQIARHLGIPENIIEKPPDPDILPGFSNKTKFFEDELQLDLVLYSLNEGMEAVEIQKKLDVDSKYIAKIQELIKATNHMRETPYKPEIRF